MAKFNSSVNVIGSIPDYGVMTDYIIGKNESADDYGVAFKFRTEKSFLRFDAAISDSITRFANEEHKRLFYDSLKSDSFPLKGKMLLLYWQLFLNNLLFKEITHQVYLPALQEGRLLLQSAEILSFLRELKEQNSGELDWSEATLKIIATKYLTILKKLGLAEGGIKKVLQPITLSNLQLLYLARLIGAVNESATVTLDQLLPLSFMDSPTLIGKLKQIELMPYWNLTQIGSDVKIELTHGNV